MTTTTTTTDERFGPTAMFMCDVCESEPADPDHPETICIRRDHLELLVQEHFAVTPERVQVLRQLIDLARIVDTAVTDWGEGHADGSSDVIFHAKETEQRDAILDAFDALPEGPDENMLLSGPLKAAHVLGVPIAPR